MREVEEVTDEAAVDAYVKAGEEEAVEVEVAEGEVIAAVTGVRVAGVAPFADVDVDLWDGMNRLMAAAHSIYLSGLAATMAEGALLTGNHWTKRALVSFLVSVRLVALLAGET